MNFASSTPMVPIPAAFFERLPPAAVLGLAAPAGCGPATASLKAWTLASTRACWVD